MAWSTQQLADLAGTTVKAVRHYHAVGLLDLPRRSANGYKQYEVLHLVRLMQIRRLSDLGVPLSAIPHMDEGGATSREALRELDAELEATVARLNRVRAELEGLLHHEAPAYLPPAFAPLAGGLTARQRSLLMVYSSVLSEDSLAEFRKLLQEPDASAEQFEVLPADADDATIELLAQRMLPPLLRSREEAPWSKAPAADAPAGEEDAAAVMAEAVLQLYNPAQMRVLRRLSALLREAEEGEGPASGRSGR
ncbi:MerR family transcriptional regulator [Streptomyces lonarensis]|uniref:MerR family transcriptional regulator n=1 Tax=Streptomyces lonarensis TaxID=700599 RepID=A0A7X6CZJ2_9ACTN|nr:MerR family transcriptional regulator [Streptomyces lonarensis]NJQ05433.1 MerR family transcriptional regulator [Streptomyces lonarensis]